MRLYLFSLATVLFVLGAPGLLLDFLSAPAFQLRASDFEHRLSLANVGLAVISAGVAARCSLQTQRVALAAVLLAASAIAIVKSSATVSIRPLPPNVDLLVLGLVAPLAVPLSLWTTTIDRQMCATRLLSVLPHSTWLAASPLAASLALWEIGFSARGVSLSLFLFVLFMAFALSSYCREQSGRYRFVYLRRNRSTFEFHFDRTNGRGERSLERLVRGHLDEAHLAAMARAGATKLVVASLHLQERPPPPPGLIRTMPERIDKLAAHLHLCPTVQDVARQQVQLDVLKTCVLRLRTLLPGRSSGVERRLDHGLGTPWRPMQPALVVTLKPPTTSDQEFARG